MPMTATWTRGSDVESRAVALVLHDSNGPGFGDRKIYTSDPHLGVAKFFAR